MSMRPYPTRAALVAASKRRYVITDPSMVGERYSAHHVREIAHLLAHYGYSPMAAKRLLRDGYGYHEIEHRAQTGQLSSQLRVSRIKRPRHARSR